MGHDLVRNAHSAHCDLVGKALVLEQFKNRGSETACQVGVLSRNDQTVCSRQPGYQFRIKRLNKPCINYRRKDTSRGQFFSGIEGRLNHGQYS